MRDSTRLAVMAAVSATVTSIVLVASGMPGSSVTAGQPDGSSQQNGMACGSSGSAAGSSGSAARSSGSYGADAVRYPDAADTTACDTLYP